MSGASLADAYCTIVPKFDNLSKSISSAISGVDASIGGGNVGKTFASGFSGGAAGIKEIFAGNFFADIASSAMGAVTSAVSSGIETIKQGLSQAFQGFSDAEQLVGGVDKIFGDASDKVQRYAASAYESAGISANDYMTQVTSFSASLLQSMGGDTSAAADMANEAIVDMSDNANVYGSNITDIQNAYQGFAKQNYMMLDNLKLGYGGGESEMQRLIDDANAWGAANGEASDLTIDSYADVIQAIHQIQESQGIAGDTAAEASGTVKGSLMQLQSAWQNLINGVGDPSADITELSLNVTESLGTFAQNALPLMQNIFTGIASALPGLFSGLAAVLPGMIDSLMTSVIPAIMTSVTTIIQSVTTMLQSIDWASMGANVSTVVAMLVGQVLPAIIEQLPTLLQAGIQIVLGIINGLTQAIPQLVSALVFAIPQLVSALISALPEIIEGGLQLFLGLVQGLTQALPQIVAALIGMIPQLVSALISCIPQILQAGVELFCALVQAIPQVISQLLPALGDMIHQAVTSIGSKRGDFLDIGKNILQGLIDGVKSMANSVVNAAKGVVDAAIQGAKNLLGIHSPSRVFREIGDLTMQGLALGISGGASAVNQAYGSVIDGITSPVSFGTVGASFGGGGLLAAGAGGQTMVVNIDGARFNDDEQIRSDVRALLVDLHRKAAM